ncbi:hypothetical protein [Rhizobium sp. FKY42]|uniref:alpha/beta hydrolase n=1 Tax=Rhizobium sp. FKY42 TaxID=2562310 RepID=UPI0010C12A93|nr:hypothetical protein [Rhizobium sp. FKY42]
MRRFIGILGASAGGHLAALAGLSSVDCPTPKAFSGIYGVYDLLAHWQADREVSPGQSAYFAETLRQAGYPVTALELPDAAHL